MASLTLKRSDGREHEYEIPESLTFREAGLVKRMSGVRGGEIAEALRLGDAEVIAALAVIAVRRTGEPITEDEILDMEVTDLKLKEDEEPEPEESPTPAASAGEAATSLAEPVAEPQT